MTTDFKKALDLDSGRPYRGHQKDVDCANSAGISGTPSFFIGVVQPNGTVKAAKKLVGAQPYATFKAAIDSLLNPTPSGSN